MRTLVSLFAARKPTGPRGATTVEQESQSPEPAHGLSPRYWVPPAAALLLFPLYRGISLWAGVGFFLAALAILQLIDASASGVALVEVMLLNYLLQYFIASFYLYFYPTYHLFDIGREHYPRYLSYGVPACLALYLGTAAGRRLIHRMAPHSCQAAIPARLAWQKYALFFIIIGNIVGAAIPIVVFPPSISFFMRLIADLRWVGLFTGVLAGSRRAWLWIAPTIVVELYLAKGGSFNPLLLWLTCSLLVLVYQERWKAAVLPSLSAGMIALLVIQNLKLSHRRVDHFVHPTPAQVLAGALPENVEDSPGSPGLLSPARLSFARLSPARLSFVIMRFDQGWIVSRVLRHTPSSTPFARGATIANDLIAAVVPRALSAGKRSTGSLKLLFARFTGIRLPEVTTIFLGPPAEMYANFGWYGGLVGMAIFGATLGCLYGILERAAARQPVWWAWAPWVGLLALKSEEAIGPIENRLVKSILLMAVIIFIINTSARMRRREHPDTPPDPQ